MVSNFRPLSSRLPIIAIGTSTGGPRALEQILSMIPKKFTTPILIVQHMPKSFTKSLAERLNRICALHVTEANHGDIVEHGNVYLAPGDCHMKVNLSGTKLKIELTKEALNMGHRPSVNVLFYSLSMLTSYHKIAVVLTGMGKDGAEGIVQLKRSDPNTIVIAESKETAIINGMPKAAVDTGCTTDIVRLPDISDTLVAYSKGSE